MSLISLDSLTRVVFSEIQQIPMARIGRDLKLTFKTDIVFKINKKIIFEIYESQLESFWFYQNGNVLKA